MKQILLSLLLLCSMGISAQDEVVTRQRKQQTTTAKPKQNSPQKKSPSVAKPKQNEQNVLVSDPTGYSNGHGEVDLGLPSGAKWATCNVGANSPSDHGDYYAWGETETKDTYDWSTYKWCKGSETTMTKYCIDSSHGTVDNKTALAPEDDVAHVKWGGDWHMPTKAELDELLDNNNCTWTWTTQGGKKGYLVTSKKNGNSIFLPASGYRFDSSLDNAGANGYYWSSSLSTSSSRYAYNIFFGSSFVMWGYHGRCLGRPVRPVCSLVSVTSITLSKGSMEMTEGESSQLSATINPTNATNKNVTWSSSDTKVATVSNMGLVTFKAAGSATITATAADGSGKMSTCTVTVIASVTSITLNKGSMEMTEGETYQLSVSIIPANATNKNVTWSSSNTDVATVSNTGLVTAKAVGSAIISATTTEDSGKMSNCTVTVLSRHEYVDLGLPSGIKWATCNVGADNPWGYGDYYAWGETETKRTYNWSTYKWCKGSRTTMTKYCTESFWGKVDNKTALGLEDDVAHVKWGGGWRMPTIAELNELRNTNNCTWTWTSQGGKNGYLVTSKKNGNSIFLPAAGYRDDSSLNIAGSYGYYWSSTLSASRSNRADYLYFGSVGFYSNGNYRNYGYTVRPVCP